MILVTLLTLLTSCAFGMGAPVPPQVRKCPQSLYLIDGAPCILQLQDDGTTAKYCPGDSKYPEDLVAFTLKGYNCERDYEDLLLSKCKKWRK